ncbi:hypothetical protein EYC98_01530 [Halieaceae bacterium IMCC14734]|uniref:Uncharacterized protein n=1 Tax=Candidatus Litorirhabdus singularis TaxID=2518993 RepID=A0ABT3TB82_9GAMM|nr:nodulation protein NodZ [Candidatus Litorirhabdus singularis]MCX2979537.1 hypothetical protein [Candidatus Litorirhabdus singularis]
MSKHLIYNASSAAGLGHVLTAVAVYADYARQTGRRFHLTCRTWNLRIDNSLDVDPIFAELFELETEGTDSIQLSERISNAAINDSNSLLLVGVGNKDIVNSFPEHERLHAHEMTHMREFRPLLENTIDHAADCIIIQTVSPFSSLRKDFPFFDLYPAPARLSDSLLHEALSGVALERHVGVHIRHGNGEFLHGRSEYGTDEFQQMVSKIMRTALDIAAERNLDIIAFSDNAPLLEQLHAEYGVKFVTHKMRPDKVWKDHLQALEQQERAQAISTMLRDFYALTQCANVVCGSSLFTTAAYIFSKHRAFTKVVS